MRYVVVCTVKGKAGYFNNKLRKELYEKFRVKSSKLPAHFTIKAPFEYEGDISELEYLLWDFCGKEHSQAFDLDGYNSFGERVIYMNVIMSEEGKAMHNRLVDAMSTLEYIKFTDKDGKDKVFHVTLASKNLRSVFTEIYEYVKQIPCKFNCLFDNISIYKWEENTWVLFKEFNIQ
ncbi:MAG: 2'-5' RNA ligase family protein [Clostridiaceae bacterium]